MNALLMDGKKLANGITECLKTEVEQIVAEEGFVPSLAVVQVGNSPASDVYVRNKINTAKKIGINSKLEKFDENITQKELEEVINKLNYDLKTDAILVQLPLPNHIDEKSIINMIDPKKDVDGFHPVNKMKLINGEDGLVPCTPLGIMKLLHSYNIEIDGKNAVVVGRSDIVGKPIASLLLNENATVTIAHSHTRNLEEITKNADILIVAVGKPNFINGANVKPGATVIDVGINRLESGKLIGDVQKSVENVAGYLTPVPKGVGPMTIAMLMEQTVKISKNFGIK